MVSCPLLLKLLNNGHISLNFRDISQCNFVGMLVMVLAPDVIMHDVICRDVIEL